MPPSSRMPSPEPEIDLTKIAFPSDSLTIKRLRELVPNRIDDDTFVGLSRWDEIDAHLSFEREIAERTFDKARGKPLKHAFEDGDLREMVAEGLIAYGLATGPHHAEELIREIESQAAAQA